MELEICSICLSSISNEDNLEQILTTKCCYNKFHRNCFTECMKIKLECPLCRENQTNHVIVINTYTEQQNYIKITIAVTFILFIIASGGMWTICSKK
jgi:hypothetical protein